ncbi:ClpP/crotonase-like domain-containing protein [Mycotypha africana]|uniref:ClpP/crotonase-like domain-containing protein n=1 Tax=Mycotypha africana TaxID=64632 RepID=UPI0023010026|nr:ClpP/crotonase-like domain-containing protein [Mycotypha africana]KAI8984448.1 ClpP/crotonase-like domain-containing protein [Mycotypha africana]
MATSVPLLKNFEINVSLTGVAELAFNKPQKYNALSPDMYKDWLTALQWAARCDAVKVAVLTGRGHYYTSGKELVLNEQPEEKEKVMEQRKELIHFPKLLIAAYKSVGNAIGFGVTSMALCDVIYAVPEATFHTPFMKLGFCAEACSSYLFPKIMGRSKANEMLLMGRVFTADELSQCGFISCTLPSEGFRERVLAIAEDAAKFSAEAIAVTKKLIRDTDRDVLLKVNKEEMARLTERLASPDSQAAVAAFVDQARRKKESKRAKKKLQQQQQSPTQHTSRL